MVETDEEITMIQVRRGTAQRIKQTPLANFGDSYDDILTKMLDQIEKTKGR